MSFKWSGTTNIFFQVAPAELEEIIRTFPNVTEAAVIGVPHDTLGEVPRAYIVAQPGTTIDCDKLMSYVADQVAPYKSLVGGISVIDNIPKNAAGKILRKDLKSKYQSLGVWRIYHIRSLGDLKSF